MSKKRKVKALGPSCPVHGGLGMDKDGNIVHIRKLRDGESAPGQTIVNVSPPDENGEQEIETLYEPPAVAAPESRSRSGPAQYATKESRATWDRIFGGKKKSEAN